MIQAQIPKPPAEPPPEPDFDTERLAGQLERMAAALENAASTLEGEAPAS